MARALPDADGDGKVECWRTNDESGATTQLEEDQNKDGKPDRVVRFAGGKPESFEEDTDFDGKPDLRGTLARTARCSPRSARARAASSTARRSTRAARRSARSATPTATASPTS